MQDIMDAIIRNLNLLNQLVDDINQQLRHPHWEDDELDIQIMQSDLDCVERELVKCSFVNCTPPHAHH